LTSAHVELGGTSSTCQNDGFACRGNSDDGGDEVEGKGEGADLANGRWRETKWADRRTRRMEEEEGEEDEGRERCFMSSRDAVVSRRRSELRIRATRVGRDAQCLARSKAGIGKAV
jgi:hypothetical protein